MGLRHWVAAVACTTASVLGFVAAQTEAVISGSFVQLSGQSLAWSQEAWAAELGLMRAVGMDTVIVQYARYGDMAYYPLADAAPRPPSDLPPNESLATMALDLPTGSSARHLRITVRPDSREWTMIPELRVLGDGRLLSRGLAYRLSPAPDLRYPDADAAQGGKLTDGLANFAWTDMVGWANPGDRIVIDLDLGQVLPLERIEIDFMRSDVSGVELPWGFSVAVSSGADGADFSPLAEVSGWGDAPADVPEREPIRHLLAAAEALDMQVFLGLGLDPSYWQGTFDPVQGAADNIAIMERLEELYGASPALAGWYLPEEIDDRNFIRPEIHEAAIQYLAAMVEAAAERGGRPVMVAPYFGIAPNGPAYAAWWDATLARARVDIIALQDGVGTRRTTAEEGVPVFEALAEVARKHGVALWSDLEVFEQIHGWPVDDRPWQAVPAGIEQLRQQLALEAPFVEKIVVFDFTHYMSPRLGGAAQTLYRDYQAYLEERGGP